MVRLMSRIMVVVSHILRADYTVEFLYFYGYNHCIVYDPT